MESLQLENRRLTDLVEDLNVQLLNQHVSRARALSDPMRMDQSFAEEFNEATKDQVYKNNEFFFLFRYFFFVSVHFLNGYGSHPKSMINPQNIH